MGFHSFDPPLQILTFPTSKQLKRFDVPLEMDTGCISYLAGSFHNDCMVKLKGYLST